MKNKKLTLLLIAFVMALTVISPLGASAASKHKEPKGGLSCSSYYQKGTAICGHEIDLCIDSTHHYIGLFNFEAGSYYAKAKITKGKNSQTITLKGFSPEKKVKKTFRGKKCTVKVWVLNKKTGKKSGSTKTYKNLKL